MLHHAGLDNYMHSKAVDRHMEEQRKVSGDTESPEAMESIMDMFKHLNPFRSDDQPAETGGEPGDSASNPIDLTQSGKDEESGDEDSDKNEDQKDQNDKEKCLGDRAQKLIDDTIDARTDAVSRGNRIYQSRFRGIVHEMCELKCIITSKSIDECEVCHLVPHSKCGSRTENSAYNAILLSRDLHVLFDRHIWTINPNTLKIEVRVDCVGKGYSIEEYDGQAVSLHDVEKSREFLIKRYVEFLNALNAATSIRKVIFIKHSLARFEI